MTEMILSEQLDLFVADIIDAVPKGELSTMEYPIFAISTRPDPKPYRFENPKTGAWMEILPSSKGRATIHDKDILLYCFGQLAEAANRGRQVSRKVHMVAYDFLKQTNRGTGGREYRAITDALVRLRGTTFNTNVRDGSQLAQKGSVFGLIDYGQAVTDNSGRLTHVEVVISEHLFAALNNKQILTYNPEYFMLSTGYERRLYELCRKHCGNQNSWEIGFKNLHNKFGVRSSLREFRRKIKELVVKQSIPDYYIHLLEKNGPDTIEKLIVKRKTSKNYISES
ncbi:replication initiator protein A [Paraglaciecola aquimarina]|uniref:Replication initiator protein A n=1 Tax=Paraglaciecola aquimarina TaxID=1235557 RepID=A0ABU3SRJ8_9ALTE|nr:replication initiator protein A [Paraglaciecola aquimarina]MDU0352630.1 replication initiator protein A [Paraglaciecola aquimarina]